MILWGSVFALNIPKKWERTEKLTRTVRCIILCTGTPLTCFYFFVFVFTDWQKRERWPPELSHWQNDQKDQGPAKTGESLPATSQIYCWWKLGFFFKLIHLLQWPSLFIFFTATIKREIPAIFQSISVLFQKIRSQLCIFLSKILANVSERAAHSVFIREFIYWSWLHTFVIVYSRHILNMELS